MSQVGHEGSTAAGPPVREPAEIGEVRPAEQIEGAHDTYDKGEVSSISGIKRSGSRRRAGQ